jgi:hypothetical protein
MSKEQAKTWITIEFMQFYLNEEIALIADSLTEQNFVSSVSDFVTANKAIAETEIRANHTQAEADIIIERLESLNYELMKINYFNIYNQVDPNIIPLNPVGIEYMEWLQADINTLKRYAPDIFAGGMDANENSTKERIQAGLKSLSELQEDVNVLKTSLESINTKA